MGKITDALDKYEHESRASRKDALTRADLKVLSRYDRKTGHLLIYDTTDGQKNKQSAETLKSKGAIQRLLANNLINPGGKLTAKGRRECERLEKRLMSEPRIPSLRTENEKTDRTDSLEPSGAEVEPINSRRSLKVVLPEEKTKRFPPTRHRPENTADVKNTAKAKEDR
ncbi:MAG: hypothetical protein GY850_14060, partial [bacterium]|nr:hypothetical protein [bacterium]